MSEHTKGPWFLINDVCVGGPIEPGWEEAGCGIAHCGMRARTLEEAKANARLIAAAPAMLAALQQIERQNAAGKLSVADIEQASEVVRLATDLTRQPGRPS